MRIKSTDPYVDLRHLQRIADDIDPLSACVVETAIEEIKKLRKEVTSPRKQKKGSPEDL